MRSGGGDRGHISDRNRAPGTEPGTGNSRFGGGPPMNERIRKARPHVTQNEDLIFEKSAEGKQGMALPPLDVPRVDARTLLGPHLVREEVADFPQVSELEVIRHFTRLASWNYAIELGMYPLGSCTMKYNPRVNEYVARL